jgi:hypothetical protein
MHLPAYRCHQEKVDLVPEIEAARLQCYRRDESPQGREHVWKQIASLKNRLRLQTGKLVWESV